MGSNAYQHEFWPNGEEREVTGPLHGIRIIDLTAVIMGPYATQVFGDMGADVIKVESPVGDTTREIGPNRTHGMGVVFINANRSKRSIVIDLKSAAGKEVLSRLIRTGDVFMYNMRPQAMERLGLGYEAVSAINPKIVYCGVYGYSQKGPYAARPAYDDLIQGASVISTLLARSGDGTPRYVPAAIADRITGLTAVNAVLAALVHRERTGEGQKIDVPMFETMTRFFLNDHLGGLSYEPPLDKGGYPRQLARDRRPYKTKDGYICALIYINKHWENFFKAIGQEERFRTDERFHSVASRLKNVQSIYAEISDMFQTRTTAEWMKLLEEADIPFSPMHDLESIVDDPHLVATDFFQPEDHPSEGRLKRMREPSEWSKTQPEATRHAPRLGEHSREILAELGYSADEIRRLSAEKVIAAAPDLPHDPPSV